MARFLFDEIGNVPLASDEVSQEAVESLMARNPPGNALVIRSNAARVAYGYEVAPDKAADESREDVARIQRLFSGTASFKDRLYRYANRGPGNVEDRSDQPPYKPPPPDLNLMDLLRRPVQAHAQQERAQQELFEELQSEELKGSQLARDIGLPDVGLPPSRWPRSAVP